MKTKDTRDLKANRRSIEEPRYYIILPGRVHGDYSYPDLLVGKYRISTNDEIITIMEDRCGINSCARGTTDDQGKVACLGWGDSLRLNLMAGGFTLNLRQYIDLINLLHSEGDIYDGRGIRLSNGDRVLIQNSQFQRRFPSRIEYLDVIFKGKGESGSRIATEIAFDHRILMKELVSQSVRPLEDSLKTSAPIDSTSFNKFGLPTKEDRNGGVYYFAPINGYTATIFSKDGSRGIFGEVDSRFPRGKSPVCGIRHVRLKE